MWFEQYRSLKIFFLGLQRLFLHIEFLLRHLLRWPSGFEMCANSPKFPFPSFLHFLDVPVSDREHNILNVSSY